MPLYLSIAPRFQQSRANSLSPTRSARGSILPAFGWLSPVSTLVTCVFCLMPEFIGAAALLKPLIGLSDLHIAGFSISGFSTGVTLAGFFFILWAMTASMASILWLQVIRSVALVFFFALLLPMLFARGFTVKDQTAFPRRLTNVQFAAQIAPHGRPIPLDPPWLNLSQHFYRLKMDDDTISTWRVTGQSRVPPSLDWPSIFVECETVSSENGLTTRQRQRAVFHERSASG